MDVVRVRITVRGLVQGVGYRAGCRREAERTGVCGEVRNRPDGSVEIVAEAPPATIDRFVQWCAEGPRYARVTATDVVAEEPEGLAGFRITS